MIKFYKLCIIFILNLKTNTMKIKTITISLLIGLSAFVWTSCVKEGPIGPQGPAGVDGNANVIASPWYTPNSWNYDNATLEYYFDVSNSAITSDIVENGAILAYASLPNDVYPYAVRPLPAYALGCDWDFLIPDYGSIEFTTDAASTPGTSGYSFRFILIPSSYTLTKSTRLKSISDLKNMPYQDVCKLLGIQE
jgi:hypothetical protein